MVISGILRECQEKWSLTVKIWTFGCSSVQTLAESLTSFTCDYMLSEKETATFLFLMSNLQGRLFLCVYVRTLSRTGHVVNNTETTDVSPAGSTWRIICSLVMMKNVSLTIVNPSLCIQRVEMVNRTILLNCVPLDLNRLEIWFTRTQHLRPHSLPPLLLSVSHVPNPHGETPTHTHTPNHADAPNSHTRVRTHLWA